MPKRLPWFKFFPTDWAGDEALKLVSLAGKGLWIEMICLMHKSDRRGYLRQNGRQVSADLLARLVNDSPDAVRHLLKALSDAGVVSVSSDGTYYSRRIVREEERHAKRVVDGRLGGNPLLVNHRVKLTVASSICVDGISEEDLEKIYEQYPKKVGRIKANEAIVKAIVREYRRTGDVGKAVAYLLQRTALYAQSKAGVKWADRKYIPLPSTWFNQERYNDDANEWGGEKPKVVRPRSRGEILGDIENARTLAEKAQLDGDDGRRSFYRSEITKFENELEASDGP